MNTVKYQNTIVRMSNLMTVVFRHIIRYIIFLIYRDYLLFHFCQYFTKTLIVERQNGKRGLESGFGSAGYVNEI